MILQQQTNRIGQFVKRLDPSEVASIDQFGRGNIFVIARKNTDNGNAVCTGASDLQCGVANSALQLVIDIIAVLFSMDLNDIVRLCIGKNDQDLMIAIPTLDQMVRQTDPESVAIAAVGNIFKNFS